ncbi:hypothetical protein [Burkholderia multivorans]|uniref:hypothetical protein n=1 Tax=Burkholderia multivorans TaxID=87883 RepID=UPI001C27AF70|nr:hypothetical protein [Burkholderia multivorans]MBU9337263.1 hypothetical protein [Burkholderia multivorans]MCA8480148.1 hypothetical protein [Burkholderia multivorans]
MKKCVLAVALGLCAVSVHAANPDPRDFSVKFAGEVPSQDVFEVTPFSWQSGDEIGLDTPEGWDGKERDGRMLAWDIKGTYGPVRVQFDSLGRDEEGAWGASLVNSNGDSAGKILARMKLRDPIRGQWMKPGIGSSVLIATAQQAAVGCRTGGQLNYMAEAGFSSGTYTGGLTAIFTTGDIS